MRKWTGKHKSHHGKVRRDESPLRLNLSWYLTTKAPTYIGEWPLDLEKLLAQDYIRLAPKTQGKEVLLRFYRNPNNEFFIQAKNDLPALPLNKLR